MSSVRLDSGAIAELLRSPAGPVMRHTEQVTEQVQALAVQKIGRGTNPSRGGRHLADTVVKRFASDGRGPKIQLVAMEPHAMYVHDPTSPHVIEPKSPGGVLVFEVAGVTVFTKRVNHPGTAGKFFFTDAAAELGLNVTRF